MVLAEIRNFKNQTYPPKPAPFTEADVKPSSQDGRVFIVTGGSSGIGFELCRILYNSGATIYLAARSKVCSCELVLSVAMFLRALRSCLHRLHRL